MARILIIDDDETILSLQKTILLGHGHEVLVSLDGLNALDLLEIYEVDLIIVDINMPRFSGFSFVETIRKNPKLKNRPIAFISASNKPDDVNQAKKYGASFYLIKPIVKDKFLEKINSFFENYKLVQSEKIQFEEPFITNAIIQQPIQILTISDLGIQIISELEFEIGQIVEIPKSTFNDVIENNILCKVAYVSNSGQSSKKVYLEFSDYGSQFAVRMKKFIDSKNRPEFLSKYPKWR